VAASRSPQRVRANSDATPPLVSQMNSVTATKRAGQRKPVFSHGHLTLQQILREGPADGDFMGALESARWKVIDEGVKSAEDGMVSWTTSFLSNTWNNSANKVFSQPYGYTSGLSSSTRR
jgi:hypothetical protein